jgi:hypothetical protein
MHPQFTAVLASEHCDELRRVADVQRLVDQARRAKSPPRRTRDDGGRAMRWLAGNLRWSLTLRGLRDRAGPPVPDGSVTCDDRRVSTDRRDVSAQRGRDASSAQMSANEAQTRASARLRRDDSALSGKA